MIKWYIQGQGCKSFRVVCALSNAVVIATAHSSDIYITETKNKIEMI